MKKECKHKWINKGGVPRIEIYQCEKCKEIKIEPPLDKLFG